MRKPSRSRRSYRTRRFGQYRKMPIRPLSAALLKYTLAVFSPSASASNADGSLESAVEPMITPRMQRIARRRTSDPGGVGAEQRFDLRQLALVHQEHDDVVVGLDDDVVVRDQQ